VTCCSTRRWMCRRRLEPGHLGLFNSHHRLNAPVSLWERLK
jgi:hypothetical protein